VSGPVPVVVDGSSTVSQRRRRVHRARLLARFTIAWNSVEGLVGIGSGIAAGSIALVGFGVDSYVEVLSGAVVLWRLSKERHGQELDATETVLCVWLSAIVLAGLVLNTVFGWWWADPVAALGIVYVAAKEGHDAWSGDSCC